MNITTAMASTLASRCLRKTVAARLRTLGPPFRLSGAVPKISGLRSAVSLTSLIPIPPILLRHRMPVSKCHTQAPRRFTVARSTGEPPRACYFQRATIPAIRSDGDRTGVLDVRLVLRGALEPGRRRGVRIHVALDDELQAGVRGRRRHQAAGELEEVEVQRGQEALQVRRLVDGEVDLARLDGGQGLRLQVEAAGVYLADQAVLLQRGAEQAGVAAVDGEDALEAGPVRLEELGQHLGFLRCRGAGVHALVDEHDLHARRR